MKVYVIGASPAGMTAAIAAARAGHKVVLLEKNEKIGKKLYITGKGRCNFTNCSSFDNYVSNIVSNPKFVYSSLKNFDCYSAMEFIEQGGVKLKTERGNRVFPQSDKSSDIIKAFNALLIESGVEIRLKETALNLETVDGKIFSIKTDKSVYNDVGAVVVATGGLSYPSTGSTGDGYKFAQNTGHRIIEPKAALTGIVLKRAVSKSAEVRLSKPFYLRGISLKNVRAEIVNKSDGRVLFSEFGEMLFTENGVSGPIILTLSSKINRLNCDKLLLKIDLKPALTESELENRLLRDFGDNLNKSIKNIMNGLLPSGLIPFILTLSGINGDKKINSVTKLERTCLKEVFKNVIFEIEGNESIESAVVTAGGVSTTDINPSTMKSKLIKNLYFAGEVIDIDALTGGYNIQLAVSTGYCAGSHIEE